ncbi:unnamed protein product, partial [Mesorhabditis spiculigera]
MSRNRRSYDSVAVQYGFIFMGLLVQFIYAEPSQRISRQVPRGYQPPPQPIQANAANFQYLNSPQMMNQYLNHPQPTNNQGSPHFHPPAPQPEFIFSDSKNFWKIAQPPSAAPVGWQGQNSQQFGRPQGPTGQMNVQPQGTWSKRPPPDNPTQKHRRSIFIHLALNKRDSIEAVQNYQRKYGPTLRHFLHKNVRRDTILALHPKRKRQRPTPSPLPDPVVQVDAALLNKDGFKNTPPKEDFSLEKAMEDEIDKALPKVLQNVDTRRLSNSNDEALRKELEDALIDEISKHLNRESIETGPSGVPESELVKAIAGAE